VRYWVSPSLWWWPKPCSRRKDAAETVFADIDPLPAVTTARAARRRPARRCCMRQHQANVCLDFHYGDTEKCQRRLRRRAAHVTKFVDPQQPHRRVGDGARSALAELEGGRLVLRLGCQGVFGMRGGIANVMGVPVEQVQVLTGNVGGSFGMKASVYQNMSAAACGAHAGPAGEMDRRASESVPFRQPWARHDMKPPELALAADGKFLALRVYRLRQSRRPALRHATVIPCPP